MKPFEFVLVIISIVIGLAFTEFANTVALMIKNYRITIFSLPYLLMMTGGILGGLNYWASVYMHRKITEWNSLSMGLLFLTALTYYANARVFFPDLPSFNHNYIEFYHEVIGPTLTLIIFWIISIVVEAYILKKGRPVRWYITMFLFVLLALSGVIIDNRTYRDVLSFIILAFQILNLIINRVMISDRVTTDAKDPVNVN